MKVLTIHLLSLGPIISAGLITVALSSETLRGAPSEAPKTVNLEDSIRLQVAKRKLAMKKYVHKILELQQAINQNSAVFLVSPPINKDAGPFLNPRVEWEDVIGEARAKAAYERYLASPGVARTTRLSLPKTLVEKLESLGADYYKKAKEFDLNAVDFGWFKELQKYDFWNIEENSPLAHLEKIDFTKIPGPNTVPLMGWAKLRLIKGAQDLNLKSAISEVVRLGRLLHSTETLLGAVSSIAVLQAVAQFAKYKNVPLRVDPSVFYNAQLYFLSLSKALNDPLIDARDFAALLGGGFGPGYCAAMNEAGVGLLMYKPLLEVESKSVFAKYEAALKSNTSCRWLHMRKAWGGDPKYVIHFKSLPSASVEARKQATVLIKQSLTDDEYMKLTAEIENPRWPQFFGYLQALKFTPESTFSKLGVD